MVDSVLDCYNYGDEGEEEDEEAGRDPEASERNQEQGKPWDQRGKTGLYGGGGRGADNTETGWVRDYELAKQNMIRNGAEDVINRSVGGERKMSLGGSVERAYEQRRADGANTQPVYQTKHEREFSSGTEPSLYGPDTPVDDTFFLDKDGRGHVIPPPLPTSIPRHSQPPLPVLLKLDPVPFRYTSKPPLRPLNKTSVLAIRRRSEPVATSPEVNDYHFSGSRSTATTPVEAKFPSIASPTRSVGSTASVTTAEGKRRKSFGSILRGKKKSIVISNPILPIGFVESLGIATYDLDVEPVIVEESIASPPVTPTRKRFNSSTALPPASIDVTPLSSAKTPTGSSSNTKTSSASPATKVPRNATGEPSSRRMSQLSINSDYAASFVSEGGQQINFLEFREEEENRIYNTTPPLLPIPAVASSSALATATAQSSASFLASRHLSSSLMNEQGVSTFSAYSNSNSSIGSLDVYKGKISSSDDDQSPKATTTAPVKRLSSGLRPSSPPRRGSSTHSPALPLYNTAGLPNSKSYNNLLLNSTARELPKNLGRRPSHDYRNSTLVSTLSTAAGASSRTTGFSQNVSEGGRSSSETQSTMIDASSAPRWNPGW